MLAAVADCHVDARTVEFGILVRGLDTQRQPGMAPLEIRQRGNQHRAGEKWQRADPEFATAAAALPEHFARGFLQARQRNGYFCEITLAVGGQAHRARSANEQLDAELLFQSADLMADRRWAQRQVARRAAEA